MNPSEEKALDALNVLGAAWRGDWSEFDGRTLRDQLYSWRALMERALNGEMKDNEPEEWLKTEGICPRCASWREWCSNPEHWS